MTSAVSDTTPEAGFNAALLDCAVTPAGDSLAGRSVRPAVRSVGCEVAHPCASEAVARTARDDISLFMKNPLYIDVQGCDLLSEEIARSMPARDRLASSFCRVTY